MKRDVPMKHGDHPEEDGSELLDDDDHRKYQMLIGMLNWYGAEFMAMKTAVEEVISVRYMLRCLGVKVSKPTNIMGDNRSVILNSTVPSSLLKKKHVAISYHKTREATAAQICRPIKSRGEWNFADVCTKAQVTKTHAALVGV